MEPAYADRLLSTVGKVSTARGASIAVLLATGVVVSFMYRPVAPALQWELLDLGHPHPDSTTPLPPSPPPSPHQGLPTGERQLQEALLRTTMTGESVTPVT
jgi:hypothetical protein